MLLDCVARVWAPDKLQQSCANYGPMMLAQQRLRPQTA